ncbi:uroporphyrinogen-III synthase [Pelagerythrobacter sp.]|uniref:uroporphyrinogen-III synthase n=1 Tax=Pelagerythrobacter sp. TaxID=2800702 RepID=UPI0035ADCD84
MSAAIFAIRPEPGLSATLEAARALSIQVEGYPLAEVAAVKWAAPRDIQFAALLLGSANAVRHAGAALAQWRGRTAHVVGAATAEAAREAGLNVGIVGQGGLQQVVDRLSGGDRLRLLRLAGERHTVLEAPANVAIDTRVVYRVVHHPIPVDFAGRLKAGGVVLLHSGEAARHFARECDRAGLAREAIALAALAPRIAEAAGGGWRRVAVAGHPVDSQLLALARDICH